MALDIIVLAAGLGKRMRSGLPKVLHPLAGRPLLAHVLDAARELSPRKTIIVHGHGAEQVRARFPDASLAWALQAEQLGTGHAVMQALPHVAADQVLILYGDVPLIRPATLERLRAAARDGLALLTVELSDPKGYGRIVRTRDGEGIERIVEEKDATPAEKEIDEVNSAIYAFDHAALKGVLDALTANNAQGEYYLTDTVSLLQAKGAKAAVWCAEDARELLGINTVEQLAEAEQAWLAMRRGSAR